MQTRFYTNQNATQRNQAVRQQSSAVPRPVPAVETQHNPSTPSQQTNRPTSSAQPNIKPDTRPAQKPINKPINNNDELVRSFNTAVIASQAQSKRDLSSELLQITESASFKAILSAVQHLARVQGIHEKQAAELIIQTFRKIDDIWSDYVFREGLEKLRTQKR